jgi:Uma2 family endonuclease
MPSPAEQRRATVNDLARARDRGLAVELVGGAIVPKAAPTPEHGQAQAQLCGLLHGFNRGAGGSRGPGGWWIMTEVEVSYQDTAEVFRHDALGFRRDRHPTRPRGMPVEERPDWVCEILSPSTARYDVVAKQRTLHAHGVPWYWIVDPEHQTLTVLRHTEEAYLQALTAGVGDVVRAEPFSDEALIVAALFGVD